MCMSCLLQARLAEGLSLAKEFHSTVQDLLTKMARCEDSIGGLPTPSYVLDTVCSQLQDHRVCVHVNCVCVYLCVPGMRAKR